MMTFILVWLAVGLLVLFLISTGDVRVSTLRPTLGRRLVLFWILLAAYPAILLLTIIEAFMDVIYGDLTLPEALHAIWREGVISLWYEVCEAWHGR